MNLIQLFKLIDKYAQTVSQKDIGDAEAIALKKTGTWAKIKTFLQAKVVKITAEPSKKVSLFQIDVSVAFGIKLSIGPKKNAINAEFDKSDIYYTDGDADEMKALNDQINSQFGTLLAKDMLKAYQTDPDCKNVLSLDAQPNSTYYARIKVKLN